MLIPTAKNTRNITDFRKDPDSILETVKGSTDPLYLFRGSEPKAVVLDIAEYIRMHEQIEDYFDSLAIAEYVTDPLRHQGKISLGELIEKYNLKVALPKKRKARINA